MALTNKYLALYRKYRPKIFDDIKGQDHIVTTLKNIILNNKLSHAYLFCGPHGNGKTSTAKVFANTINCLHNQNDILKPCEECIKNVDRNLDIIEIDAASNTGIDDIRELKEKIKHLPTQSKYKIYIIDEVHMLSKAAFNALLKTIEDPPSHIIFILATTDPQKIPETILSRVQRFNFKLMTTETLVSQLKDIFNKENIEYEDDAINVIAKLGNGSLRDSLSIADHVAIYCANKVIKKEVVEQLFGIVNIDNKIELLNCMSMHDINKTLNLARELFSQGIDINILINDLINILKEWIIFNKTRDQSLVSTDFKILLQIKIDDVKAHYYIETLIDQLHSIAISDSPEDYFEILLLKLCNYLSPKEEYKNSAVMPKISNEEFNNFNSQEKQIINKNNIYKSLDLSSIANGFNANNSTIQNSSDNNSTEDLANNSKKIDDLLEKTAEIYSLDQTSEFEVADISNQIISNNQISIDSNVDNQETADLQISENWKDLVNEDLISKENSENKHVPLETIIDCLLIKQYLKNNMLNDGRSNFTDIDAIKYGMLSQKITDKNEINILSDFKIIFSTNDFILLTCDIDEKVYDLNINSHNENIMAALNKVFDRYLYAYAITKDEILEAKKYWKENINEIRAKKVKPLEDLNLKYNKTVQKDVAWAQEIFGDKFKLNK